MSEFIKILKISGLILLIGGILALIGNQINQISNLWTSLTAIMTAIRFFLNACDWFIPVDILIPIITTTLILEIGEWAFLAGLLPINWLKKS